MSYNFERLKIGNIGLIQETKDGKIIQLGLTSEQSTQLQIFLGILSQQSALVQMGDNYELILKSQIEKL